MPGYQTFRTAAPALVRLARTRAAANAGFLAMILVGGFVIDRLFGVLLTVLEIFTK
ncbi:hypothetical protein [Massilia sp. BKSP1R2A-1]|uniref:hypothetical protein n=1 Tax=Massilia sp. BKSP1R2A-1 TaxID=3422595 RepID=UPI003D328DBA